MDFFERYSKLLKAKKREIRNRIISECKIQPPTFSGWITRKSIPAWHQQTIAKIIQLDINELFPKNES